MHQVHAELTNCEVGDCVTIEIPKAGDGAPESTRGCSADSKNLPAGAPAERFDLAKTSDQYIIDSVTIEITYPSDR